MSFSNISYFEANQQIPKNRENPIPNINDFPALPNRDANQNGIPFSQRRSEALTNTRLPTYSQKIRTPKRRRSHDDEYDKKKSQECLISPPGRSTSLPTRLLSSPLRPEEGNNIKIDVIQALDSLSDQHKELVMTFIVLGAHSIYRWQFSGCIQLGD